MKKGYVILIIIICSKLVIFSIVERVRLLSDSEAIEVDQVQIEMRVWVKILIDDDFFCRNVQEQQVNYLSFEDFCR